MTCCTKCGGERKITKDGVIFENDGQCAECCAFAVKWLMNHPSEN